MEDLIGMSNITWLSHVCHDCHNHSREYQIGMEIHRGSDQYRTTRVVTFVARFQLENGTSFKLTYVQRHLLLLEDSSISTTIKESSVIMPSALMAFHWPRTDLDQLLCIR